MRIHLLIINILLLLLFFGCQNITENKLKKIEENLQPPVQLIDSTVTFNLTDQLAKYKIRGVSISIINNYEVVYSKSVGIIDIKNKREVNNNTYFQFGSISKPVTALAILKLVDMGVLDLNEDVNTYLEDWNLKTDFKITIRQLLSHTGGINVSGFSGYEQSEKRPDTIVDVLEGNFKNPRISSNTIPGVTWNYSGGGYAILEKVIEDVTEKRFDQFIQDEIFSPLHMNSSSFLYPKDSVNVASGHYNDGSLVSGKWNLYPISSAAGLWSTTRDISQLCMSFQSSLIGKKGIISKGLAQEVLRPIIDNWGLGFEIVSSNSVKWIQHGGNTKGYTSRMICSEEGKGIIISLNSDVEERLLPQIIRGVSKVLAWEAFDPIVIEPYLVNEKILNAYAGDYRYEKEITGIGEYKTYVIYKNGNLWMSNPTRDLRFIPATSDSFIIYETGDRIKFKTNSDSLYYILNDQFRFDKIKK